MPKVSVGLGLTVQIGDENSREFARPSVEISDIDTEKDINSQITAATVAVMKIWDAESKLVYDKLVEVSDVEREGLLTKLTERIQELEKGLEKIKRMLKEVT